MEITERIIKANLIENPLDLVPNFKSYISQNNEFQIISRKSSELDECTKKWIFELLEKNMKKIYEKSISGWNENFKLEELFDKNACYLIAYKNKKPVGYSHFRFDMDFENEVVYCYELQIEEDFRRFGLGKYLMEILENLCENLELEKVMLTVSKHNEIGQSFFKKKMKYQRDETDINDEDPTIDYEILSKVFWEEDEI
ncbi:N-alpha-acetyltransferase 40 [Brachionus plicatilis]|uniref:N-alpha-acetyltransferase 40 n=1 Tax=Brachionus plicatilis TaxID=10195 RepID=A0A3M7SP96_BRAPC|nr:N-alpha-acetyltransferase 40 [Brachionus plicatilis]